MRIISVTQKRANDNCICTVEIAEDRFVNCNCLVLRPYHQKAYIMPSKDGSLVFDSKGNTYPGYPFSEGAVLSLVFAQGNLGK